MVDAGLVDGFPAREVEAGYVEEEEEEGDRYEEATATEKGRLARVAGMSAFVWGRSRRRVDVGRGGRVAGMHGWVEQR